MTILDLMDIDTPQFLSDLERDFINHLKGVSHLMYYPEGEIINFLQRYPPSYSFNEDTKNVIQKYLCNNIFISHKLIKIIRRIFPCEEKRIEEIFIPPNLKMLNLNEFSQTIKKRLDALGKQEFKEAYDINLIIKLMEYLLSFNCLQGNENLQCRAFIDGLKGKLR